MALLEVHNVSKAFGHTPVLHDIAFAVAAGEIACLLGPSGCGKTTLLRIIAGLEHPDRGVVRYAGQDLASTPAHRRGFGLMFQDYALFPHKSVAENIAFGLRMAGQDRPTTQHRVAAMLDLVNLTGYAERRVHELSGGEQQRVALARSLAPSPRLLMLDEPLGSLDRTLREELMVELRRILKQIGVTGLYVTHDQQEAFAIADRVLILNAGRIEQQGTPLAVYRRPASRFVARFLGMHNLVSGQVLAAEPRPTVATPIGVLACADCAREVAAGDAVTVLVRPDAATLLTAPGAGGGHNCARGVLANVSFRGSQVKISVDCGANMHLTFELPGAAAGALPAPGQPVTFALDPDGLTLLPAEPAPPPLQPL